MLNYLLEKYIQYAENIKDETAFIVFEGIPLGFLLRISERIPFYSDKDKLFCEDLSKINLDYIFENELDLIAGIRNEPPKLSLLLYEEFIIIMRDRDLLKKKFSTIHFHVFHNNLFYEYPNESNHDLTDYYNNPESNKQPDEDEVFNYFYLYSKKYDHQPGSVVRLNQVEVEKAENIHHRDFFISTELEPLKLVPIEEQPADILTTDCSTLFQIIPFLLFHGQSSPYQGVEVPEQIEDLDRTRLQVIQSIFAANRLSFDFYLKGPVYTTVFRPEIVPVLQRHWGPESSFRELPFYEKPYSAKQTITISQGAIIEFVIDQAEKALNSDNDNNIPFRNIFLTAPTGSGKSILFQLPALYLARNHPEKPVTIVVLPLIALIHDMIDNLTRQGIKECTYIDSTISYADRAIRLEQVQQGEKSLLFLSPELFMAFQNLNFLGYRKLGLLVIDESHTVCTWGKEFRSDYWNLGRYVSRLKKIHYQFPVFALTATAIYGGEYDMVREIIKSLKIDYPEPQLYIGNVRRDYIEFQVRKFTPIQNSSYESDKKECTKNKIEFYVQNNVKSIVYFPWVRTLRDVDTRILSGFKSKVAEYSGKLQASAKDSAVQRFIRNEISTILATKAFGMGVDISDVMHIYHHAPSGSFSDYIQEIGRLRKQEANGTERKKYAEIDYGYKDMDYSKKLFFLSSIKQYQIRLALQKINSMFKARKTNSRNFLISLDDFAFIFNEMDEDKIRRMLIMIEEALHPYLIVRPRTLFSSVYALVPDAIKTQFINKYGAFAATTKTRKPIGEVYSIQLDKIWENFFSLKTFPEVKYTFFQKKLFTEFINVNEYHPDYKHQQIYPQLKLVLELNNSSKEILNSVNRYFDYLQKSIYNIGNHYFKKSQLETNLESSIPDEDFRSRLTELTLNIFCSPFDDKQPATFWKSVYRNEEKEYLTDFADFLSTRERILTAIDSMTGSGGKSVSLFITANDEKNAISVKSLYLIEFLKFGTYALSGGENPMIFIRVNDPDKLDRMASNPNYQNKIVSDLYKKHQNSIDIFNHFFTKLTENKKRWDFVENYFLGKDVLNETDNEQTVIIKAMKPSGDNNGAQLASFYRVWDQLGSLPDNISIQLDFKDVDFVLPSFALPLAIVINGIKKRGINVKITNASKIINYLTTIGFEQGGRLLALNEDKEQFFKHFKNKDYLGILSIPMASKKEYLDNADQVLRHFKQVLIDKLTLPMEIQMALHYLVSELFDNILQHSGGDKLWIFAQYYKKKEYFDIGIIDTGRGVLNSYLEHGFDELASDMDALEYAINGNSTKDYYNERGKGLSSSRKMIIEGLNGDFIVITGNAMYFNDRLINTSSPWIGTAILFRLPKFKADFNYMNYID